MAWQDGQLVTDLAYNNNPRAFRLHGASSTVQLSHPRSSSAIKVDPFSSANTPSLSKLIEPKTYRQSWARRSAFDHETRKPRWWCQKKNPTGPQQAARMLTPMGGCGSHTLTLVRAEKEEEKKREKLSVGLGDRCVFRGGAQLDHGPTTRGFPTIQGEHDFQLEIEFKRGKKKRTEDRKQESTRHETRNSRFALCITQASDAPNAFATSPSSHPPGARSKTSVERLYFLAI